MLPTMNTRASGDLDETRLKALLESEFHARMQASPEAMTDLGLDEGQGAWARSRLDDRSDAARVKFVRRHQDFLRDLATIDRAGLSARAAVSHDTVRYQYELLERLAGRFAYGVKDTSRPYALSQINGAYLSVPDFLDSKHRVDTHADAESYLARLAAFATAVEQETEQAYRDGARGALPPDFIIDKTLLQLKTMHGTPGAQTTLVTSLVRRTAAKGIAGDWGARATQLVEGPVRAALSRQISQLEDARRRAVSDAGVWRLPEGDEYYRLAARLHTTTDMSVEEIHRLGIEQVAEISASLDALLRAQGLSSGTVSQRVAALTKDARFLYPDTEAGRAQLLTELNEIMRVVQSKLSDYFHTLPKTRLEVKRVPAAIETVAARGYFLAGTLDGSRSGAYYINLRDTAEWPKWFLPTFAYHEGVPGHYLQMTVALEAHELPMLIKTMDYPGYSEGWAVYAEQLADEMGVYSKEPFDRIGLLQSLLFRAMRLVVDTGLHAQRWTRQRAIRYIVDTSGDPESWAVSETERYCAWPGQALSYKIGHTRWAGLRARAQQQLGAKFDIRKFHDVGLLMGAMPLDVLERVVDEWIAATV